MKLKKLAALVMTAVLAVSLTACGGTGDTTGGDASTDTEESSDAGAYGSIVLGESYTDLTTTIKFLHHKTDREEDGTMADLISKFNEVYPNITVETEGVTDYAEDSLLRLSTGDWGDVMFIPAIDKADLSTYFIPYGSVDEMDRYINFPRNWEADGIWVMLRDFSSTRKSSRMPV